MTSMERLATWVAILAGALTWAISLDVHAQRATLRPPEPVYDTTEGPMATPRPRPEGRFRLQLDDGSMVFGKLLAKESWKMKSALGEVTVPIKNVVSLQIQGDSKSATVAFRNGDRLTGELSLTRIKVETKWSEFSLDLKHIRWMISNECLANSHCTIPSGAYAVPAASYPTPPSVPTRGIPSVPPAPSIPPPSTTPVYPVPRFK